jgi:hypothetical protein
MIRILTAIVLALASAAPVLRAQEMSKATQALLEAENLGGLRLDLSEKETLKLLGKPSKQGKLVKQEADGTYVQDWYFPAKGIELTMTTGGTKTGAKKIVNITAFAPCTLATKLGLKIGSPESAVRKAYAVHVDRDSPAEPGTFVVGSIYGGMIFHFEKGQVSRIFIGAAAE